MQAFLTLLDAIPPLAWLAAVLSLALLLWLRSGDASRRSRARVHRAQRAEDAAEALLEAAGYAIEDRQVRGELVVEIDGVPETVTSRADLLVSRDDRWFVAEVKSGALVTNPKHPSTRRQLLEYQLTFDVDGILLVDMETERIVAVRFPV